MKKRPAEKDDITYVADNCFKHQDEMSELELAFGSDTLNIIWLRSGTGMTVQSVRALEGKRLRIAFFRDGITVQMCKNLEGK